MYRTLDNVEYKGKSTALKVADGLLYCAAGALKYENLTVVKDSKDPSKLEVKERVLRVQNAFARVLLAIVAFTVFLIPTLIGLAMKHALLNRQIKEIDALKAPQSSSSSVSQTNATESKSKSEDTQKRKEAEETHPEIALLKEINATAPFASVETPGQALAEAYKVSKVASPSTLLALGLTALPGIANYFGNISLPRFSFPRQPQRVASHSHVSVTSPASGVSAQRREQADRLGAASSSVKATKQSSVAHSQTAASTQKSEKPLSLKEELEKFDKERFAAIEEALTFSQLLVCILGFQKPDGSLNKEKMIKIIETNKFISKDFPKEKACIEKFSKGEFQLTKAIEDNADLLWKIFGEQDHRLTERLEDAKKKNRKEEHMALQEFQAQNTLGKFMQKQLSALISDIDLASGFVKDDASISALTRMKEKVNKYSSGIADQHNKAISSEKAPKQSSATQSPTVTKPKRREQTVSSHAMPTRAIGGYHAQKSMEEARKFGAALSTLPGTIQDELRKFDEERFEAINEVLDFSSLLMVILHGRKACAKVDDTMNKEKLIQESKYVFQGSSEKELARTKACIEKFAKGESLLTKHLEDSTDVLWKTFGEQDDRLTRRMDDAKKNNRMGEFKALQEFWAQNTLGKFMQGKLGDLLVGLGSLDQLKGLSFPGLPQLKEKIRKYKLGINA